MSNELQTYFMLWLEKEDVRDSERCRVLNGRFDQKLDDLGLRTENKIDLSNLNSESNAAYEEQGFVAGFQMASRMCLELFKASLGGG